MSLILQDVLAFSFILLLLACVKHYSRKSRLPSEAWILMIGIGYGLLKKEGGFHDWPALKLDADAILFFFLPLLIFASSRHVNGVAMKTQWAPILLYALPGVILSAFVIAAPIAWILGIPLLHALLFGAAIGATDPIAVGAIFQKFSLNSQLDMLIEGESLFNDGTTVALFSLLSAIVLYQQPFAWLPAVGTLSYTILLSIPVGILGGWIMAKVLAVWSETQVFFSASLGLVAALLLFALSEHVLHSSGVITVLCTALVMSRMNSPRLKEDKDLLDSFWSYTSQTLNGFMFFMLGVATGLHQFDLPGIALVVGIPAMLVARSLIIYTGGGLLNLLGHHLPFRWQTIMVLGGLRGAVSAALILMIPESYAHRDDFLCLAFFLIAFSLILQPLIMDLYLERLKKNGVDEIF